VGIRSPLTSV